MDGLRKKGLRIKNERICEKKVIEFEIINEGIEKCEDKDSLVIGRKGKSIGDM